MRFTREWKVVEWLADPPLLPLTIHHHLLLLLLPLLYDQSGVAKDNKTSLFYHPRPLIQNTRYSVQVYCTGDTDLSKEMDNENTSWEPIL